MWDGSRRRPGRRACQPGRTAAALWLLVTGGLLATTLRSEALELPGDQYWQAVELYRQGDRAAADEALADLGPSDLIELRRRVDQLAKQASGCESCEARQTLGERPLLAAALLHTDRAWPSRARMANRTEIETAYALVKAAAVEDLDSSLSRRWLLAVTLRAHGAADGSLAIRWAEEATRSFPGDATFRMVHGAIEEALCGFSSLGVQQPLEVSWVTNARLVRAKRHYDAALREQPDLHEARLRRGRVRALLGDSGANGDLRTVAEESRDPRLVYLAHLFQGRLLEVRGKTNEAAAAYRAAAEAFPGRTAHLALSHLLIREGGHPGLPRRELEKAVEIRPHDTLDPFRDYPWGRSREAAALLDELRTHRR